MISHTVALEGPAAPAPAQVSAGKGGGMEPVAKVNVLLVDDQPSNLLALEAVLAGEGLNLVRAHSGEQALSRILDTDYAAILMDVHMPGMDGFETAEVIRERDRSRHTPILFLTAFQATEAQIDRGYSLGAVDFLSKPIVPAVLRAKIAVFVDLFLKTEQVRRQGDRLVENQRREHERTLAEERRRWELERLREEAAREKRAAEELAQKAAELTRSIAERMQVEEQLRARATQQEIVVDLGQRALAGSDQDGLLNMAVDALIRGLGADFARVMELIPGGDRLEMCASVGWPDGTAVREAAAEDASCLAGYTIRTGEPVAITDLDTEARFIVPEWLRELGAACGLCTVIRGRDRPFGTLGVYSYHQRTFSRDDIHFVQAVANVLAAAIQRWRDERELSAVKDELEIQLTDMTRLHSLSERLSNSLELPAVLEKVLTAVTGLQGTDAGILLLYDRERDAMTTAASIGFTPELLQDRTHDSGGGETPEAITAVVSGGIIIEDMPPDPVLAPHLAAARQIGRRAVCSTPLLTYTGELVGVIATYFPEAHHPSERENRLVELYARQAAESIDNARLYREIQQADRRKSEFLAMLGHELRNPLAPILNALHLLRLENLAPEEVAGAQDIAERQVRHLARLVDDLLDVSRINNGKVELRRARIDLREAAARAVETARPLIEARCQALDMVIPEEPVILLADEARLEQVLANLLNNAAKYTEPGGRIALELCRDGDEAVVRVRDNGIGIDPELLPCVFELFTQADRSLDRSQGGLGIGLTLVRRLVELHGGRVAAHSDGVGQGSEFVIRLPIGRPASSAQASIASRWPASAAQESSPRRVLVVDDNVDGARILARLLSASGHHVEVAHDGVQALLMARDSMPDVVLLDIGLPEMSGYEVARQLRATRGLEKILLIAVTGYGQEADRLRSSAAGFDHHLVKPVDPDIVRRLISQVHPVG